MTPRAGSTRSFLDTGALAFAAPLFEGTALPERVRSQEGGVYELERELGRGGMATVYLARDPKHDRLVALKVLDADFTSPAASERFVREIRLTARLQHPLIVTLVDSGVFAADAGGLAGRPYYTMPYVQGESLRSRLARGALSLREAMRVLHDVAEALAYAHAEGVVHRDIKPANILLSRGHAVVTDFGIASAITLSAESDALVGTPAYMAPEQTVIDGSIDARSDLYSFGVVAYEMLAGRHPFAACTTTSDLLRAHRSERVPALDESAGALPRPLSLLVRQLLEKNPSDRPQSADDVFSMLETVPNVARRHASWRAAIAVLLFAVLGAGGYAGVTRAAHARPTPLGTNSAAARAYYVEGRRFWQQRTRTSMETARRYFEGAIAVDSSFANAWSGLADVYVISPMFEVGSPLELFPKAKRAAQRAIALDSTLAEAHASLARVLVQYDGDRAGAERELKRALAIEPRNAIFHQRYADFLWWGGRHEESFREADRALAIDSLSRVVNLLKGILLSLDRRPEEAIAQLEHTVQLDPEFAQAHASLGAAYLRKGSALEAVRELETAVRLNESSHSIGELAYAYAASGQRLRARAILDSALARSREHYVAPTTLAIAYAGLGDSAQAIVWFERAAAIRDPSLPFALSYSFLDWLRADARIAALVRLTGAS